jgi:hypothetical protein
MRRLSSIIATLLLTTMPAMAQSKWLESARLDTSELSAICKRASDVRTLARTQMITSGNERWKRLSQQEFVVEAFVMGKPPLDPGRCYVVARAGRAGESSRRVFEARDFAVSGESTSVFVIGRGFELPADGGEPSH